MQIKRKQQKSPKATQSQALNTPVYEDSDFDIMTAIKLSEYEDVNIRFT